MTFIDPKPLQIASYYVLGKVNNFQGRSGGKFSKYRGFKVGGPLWPPPRPLRVKGKFLDIIAIYTSTDRPCLFCSYTQL